MNDDRAALVSSAHALLHLALSNAGPRARLSVLQSSTHTESLTVTTSSARILPELCVGHAATRLLVQTARSHRTSNYDGGWLLIAVAAGLIVRAFSSADRPPIHLLLAGHQVALQWCYDFFNHPRCPVTIRLDWSHLQTVHTLVRSRLQSKATAMRLSETANSDDAINYLSTLILRAFVAALPDQSSNQNFRPQIRLSAVGGASFQTSRCLTNAILLDIPLPLGWHAAANAAAPNSLLYSMARSKTRSLEVVSEDEVDQSTFSTLLYNVSITCDENEQQFQVPSNAGSFDLTTIQCKYFQGLVDSWSSLGISMVASQKLLHPFLQSQCLAAGILPLERLSARHIAAMHALCGGTLSSSATNTPTPGSISFISEIVNVEKRFVLIRGHARSQHQPIVTLLLRAPSQSIADELSACAQQCIDILHSSMSAQHTQPAQDARTLVAGAGATESLLASYLRLRCKVDMFAGLRVSHHSWLKQGVCHFADSLDAFASAVRGRGVDAAAGITGPLDLTALTSTFECEGLMWRTERDALHSRHAAVLSAMFDVNITDYEQRDLHSVNVFKVQESGSCADDQWSVQALCPADGIPCVLDSLQCTRRALELAVDAAANALRCGGTISSRK